MTTMMTAKTIVLSILLAAAAPLPAGDWSRGYLSNEGLVLLARAGYGERFLAELVQTQPARFDTSVEGLVFLAKNGVSEKMVKLVLAIQRKADQEEESGAPANSTHAAPAHAAPAHSAPAPAEPIRLRAVRQTVLVPESMARSASAGQVLLLDPRLVQVR
jgi:hypothetical protein